MLIEIPGVLQDGSNRAPTVPENSRTALQLYRFGTVTVRVRVTRSNGSPIAVPTGAVFTLAIKQPVATDIPPILSKVGAINTHAKGVGTVVDFAYLPGDFRVVTPGYYCYDVTLDDSLGNQEVLVPLSPLYIEPNAKRFP